MTHYYWRNYAANWRSTEAVGDKYTGSTTLVGWSLTSGGGATNAYPSGPGDVAVFDGGSGTCQLSDGGVELAAVHVTGWTGGFTLGATLSAANWTIQSDASYISGSERALCTGVCTLGGEASRLPSWLDFGEATTLTVQKSGVGLGGLHAGTMIVVDEAVETLALTADLTAKDIRIGSVDGEEFPAESITSNGHLLTLTERGPEPPAIPSGLTATSVSGMAIMLDWSTVTNANGYVLERSESGVASWSEVYRGTEVPFADANLKAQTTYWYRVKAVNATGSSDWSTIAHATTKARQLILAIKKDGKLIGFRLPDGVVEWSAVLNTPATYPPSTHTHSAADIADLEAMITEIVAGMLP